MPKVLTTVSIRRDTKRLLERVKRDMELEAGRALSWDEFFLMLVGDRGKGGKVSDEEVLFLSDEEAKALIELTRRGRESWSERVSTQAY